MSKPTVAILGASADRSKFGNKSVRAHLKAGYDVYPVNPKGGEIEGLTVYERLADIPVALERISSYLPPSIGLGVLEEVAAKGCAELWLNPGAATPELVRRAQSLGIRTINSCSIVQLGLSPSQFGDK
jgi:predicted CoA-binding protein